MVPYKKKLQIYWNRFKTHIKAHVEVTDVAFICLRIIIFCGGVGWLIFTEISQKTFEHVTSIFLFFVVYSVFIYVWLFFSPKHKSLIYVFCLFFDLIFATVLVMATGGFDSQFFTGFYLITALYSFKFGLVPGIIIAVAAMLLYLLSGEFDLQKLYWTDFSVRAAFMFLLALPIGILSQELRRDKAKIENLNRDLEKYIEELQDIQGKLIQAEKLSALGRMTADVAHEIRNPLTSIGGFARRLNRKLPPGTREKEYAEIVVSEVDRLERILKDVLTFSREAKFEMKYHDINKTVKESIHTFSGVCKEQSIKVVEELDVSLPEILIDNDQIRQAVNNLLSNAIDAMSSGGTLTIRTYMEEMYRVDFVVVEVNDTGPGLTKEALNMIFEPFYTTKEIGAGTGLGLSICKKIMDEHNGLILVNSELGKGTTFKMYFPYQSREDGKKINCWEFNKCGVEKMEAGAGMRCPCYPHYGRICWVIAGTFCGKKVSGAFARKLRDCRKCQFYQHVAVKKDL